jgi:hypothetical protein
MIAFIGLKAFLLVGLVRMCPKRRTPTGRPSGSGVREPLFLVGLCWRRNQSGAELDGKGIRVRKRNCKPANPFRFCSKQSD